MSFSTIGLGSAANDGTGDPLRTALGKVNTNFGLLGVINGLVKMNGSSTPSAAAAGTDYLTPSGNGSGLTSLNASALGSGTVAAARGGAGTINGILKANGSGVVSQATSGTDYLPATWTGSTNLVTVGTGIITGLTEDTTPSADNDFVMTYDASASSLKKVKVTNLPGGGSNAETIFNVKDYGATGLIDSTTGNATASSNVLTSVGDASIFSVGDGILIYGAGTAGANFVSSVTSVNVGAGTITMAAAAITNSPSALIIHDDTVAINDAIAAAHSTGYGGTIYFPKGFYRCGGPLNGTTNSVLTIPVVTSDANIGITRTIHFRGEVMGATGNTPNDYLGGVILDFRAAPTGSGTMPAAISGMPYAATGSTFDGTLWNNVGVSFRDMMFVLPANSTLSGLMFSNTLQVHVGDFVHVLTDYDFGETEGFTEPTNPSVGIYFPLIQNRPPQRLGAAVIGGFKTGVVTGEHLIMQGAYTAYCFVGLEMGRGWHLVEGSICIERCNRFIQPRQGESLTFCSPMNITLQCEPTQPSETSRWWNMDSEQVYDPDGLLYGRLSHCVTNSVAEATPIVTTGTRNLTFVDLKESAYTGSTLLSGLVAYWNLEESSGARSAQVGGGSLTMYEQGGTVGNATGHYGYGASFIAADNVYLGITGTSIPSITSGVTVSLWANCSTSHVGAMFNQANHNSGSAAFEIFTNSGVAGCAMYLADGESVAVIGSAGLGTSAWHHILMTYSQTTKTLKLYVDGILDGTDTATGTGAIDSFDNLIQIGANHDGATGSYFDGVIDEVGVWNRVLTDGEIAAVYAANTYPFS